MGEERLFNTYHPTKFLRRKWIASYENPRPPKLVYGWAYQLDFLGAYASKHKLRVPLYGVFGQRLGKPFVTYGELTEAELQDEALHRYVADAVWFSVREHLAQRAGVRVKLSYAKSFTNKYRAMFVVWDNYDIEERHDDIAEAGLEVEDVLSILEDAMTECGRETEALWWYDWNEIRADLTTPI
ncbi:hypothetical protein C8Q74DRAFT_1374394 [Fomes fomentarius]|nr:hypothetical protein C8Q74DRAFT_1374394 [Fomes fomentarius]